MYKLINGWTKEKVLAQVKKYNNGKQALAVGIDKFGSAAPMCMYKTPDGNRCFVGAFIPDNHPGLMLENANAPRLLRRYPDLSAHMPFEGYALLSFQGVHDDDCGRDYHENLAAWLKYYVE